MTDKSRIAVPLDLGATGKRWGRIAVPLSRHESAYGHIPVPIAVIVGGAGPTVFVSGGVHGDEYEGQIEIARYVNAVDPAEIKGRLIAIPSMNLPAALAHRRTSPVDDVNLGRAFPGDRNGTITHMFAHFVETEILPHADAVLDMHSGGSSLEYIPAAIAREGPDLAATRAAMAAFGAPYGAAMRPARASADSPTSGGDDRTMLASAHRLGIPCIATEMGGAGTTRPVTLETARRGLRNVLAHWKLIDPPHARPAETRLVDVRPEHHVYAPRRGVFAPAFDLGDVVPDGSVFGHIHDLEQPEDVPVPVIAKVGGTVLARRVPAKVEPGDCLAQLCIEAE
jgi:predicted deacylase